MKKVSLFLAVLLATGIFSGCAGGSPESPEMKSEKQQETAVSLWTFPVGNWGNPTAVASLLAGFHKQYPHIHVSAECLGYDTGDARIAEAIAAGAAPDLVFEGPERLVATWGDQGLMVDLTSLWASDAAGTIYKNVRDACLSHSDGTYYAFPVCMTAHCIGINYDLFKAAGALQYLDERKHSWTTEGFIKAVEALTDYGMEKAAVLYCKNQSGDQGTRALVNNLYGGSFTDDSHTVYTVDSAENIRALQLLYDLPGVTFEPSLTSADAIEQFCKKETAMTFCWNVSLEVQQTINNPNLDFEILPMAFPTEKGDPELPGGIWGFGIFDSGDPERIEAAKCLIRYMTESDEVYRRAVLTSTYWPVRDVENIYVNDILMTEYGIFMPYMGDYYQVTPGWPEARTAWWQALQKIGEGVAVPEAVKGFPAAE